MPRFKLELLPEDFPIEKLHERGKRFVEEMTNQKSKPNEETQLFFKEITERPWYTLRYLDGHRDQDKYDRDETRARIETTYLTEEVQEAFTLAVNTALLIRKEGFPGNMHGHSILWDQVATDQDSWFYDSITPEFQRRLVNGTFWEQIGRCQSFLGYNGFATIEDLLVNHWDKLDLGFVKKGLQFFEKETGYSKHFHLYQGGARGLCWENNLLSERAILQYGKFIQAIDATHNFQPTYPTKRLAPLITAYVDALEGEDEFGTPVVEEGKELLKQTWFKKYEQFREHLIED
jgi:hypothetical protein